jgi:hypothetical protein
VKISFLAILLKVKGMGRAILFVRTRTFRQCFVRRRAQHAKASVVSVFQDPGHVDRVQDDKVRGPSDVGWIEELFCIGEVLGGGGEGGVSRDTKSACIFPFFRRDGKAILLIALGSEKVEAT